MPRVSRFNSSVPERQLHLFEAARPLLERFGSAFFKAVPRRPGVYIMSGEGERVLYIGQSRNLRQRLGSYKNARPDRAPRKVIRLIHSVRSLVWEECKSVEAARLKEAQLLRVHRPRFNVQNTFPRAYRFISVGARGEELQLRLTPELSAAGQCYGAFKAGVTQAFGALLRLIWAALHQPQTHHDFPIQLLQPRPPAEFTIAPPSPLNLHFNDNRNFALDLSERPIPSQSRPRSSASLKRMAGPLDALLAGESSEFIHLVSEWLAIGSGTSIFQRNLLAADLETLSGFYEYSARRNRELRRRHGMAGTIIPQETLDDLLALGLAAPRRAPNQ